MHGLNEQTVTRWFEEDVDVRLRLLENLPSLPMYVPEIVAREVEGREPGIQVADHLLWRERRFAVTDRTLENVVTTLAPFLGPALGAAHEPTSFRATWSPQGPWIST